MQQQPNKRAERIVDAKWQEIFADYNVLSVIQREGAFMITATEINQYKEARLMTKFDFKTSLPAIFRDNYLSILPTRRGEYVIGHFDAYEDLPTNDETLLTNLHGIAFPEWIETIAPRNITSESTTINAAAASGMLQDLFNEPHLIQTVSGRMSSQSFGFQVGNVMEPERPYAIDVTNAQIEIDGGFETPDKLILFEAKNTTVDTFLVRQLFYPYQLWARQVQKEVVPVFLQYANNTFNFSIYQFDDLTNYNSLRLVERRNYVFHEDAVTVYDLVQVMNQTPIRPRPVDIPLPQADTIAKVLDVLEGIWQSDDGVLTLEDLTLRSEYVFRQAQYYSNAARYLNFVVKTPEGGYALSDIGVAYINGTRRERNLLIAEQILGYDIFRTLFQHRLNHQTPLTKRETFHILERNGPYDPLLGQSTRYRRTSTVISWVQFLFSLTRL